MKKENLLWLASTLVFLFGVGIASAQVTTGSISGTVKDSSGAVLPGATVVIRNDDTGAERTLQTDVAGRYSASALSLGNMRVTATLTGFQTQVRSGIVLTVGREAVVPFELTIGAVSQAVEVTGEAPVIETSNATVSGLVSQEQIRDLPLNGRSYADLAVLSPGVFINLNTQYSAAQGFAARMSINGSRYQSNLFLLDGAVTNDAANNGGSAAGAAKLGVEAVREFRVLTHNFTAEYGRVSGGVVSAVTRSGTNQFHGSAYEFVRNDIFDARDFYNPNQLPPFRRNQFGGAFGGPIVRDRMFFFANYEGERQRRGISKLYRTFDEGIRQGLVPVAGTNTRRSVPVSPILRPYLELYPLPNGPLHRDSNGNPVGSGDYTSEFSRATDEDYYLGRTDITLGEQDSLFWRYVYDPSTATQPTDGVGFISVYEAVNHFASIGETHVFSGAALNDFRVSFNRTVRVADAIPWLDRVDPPELTLVQGVRIGELGFTLPGGASVTGYGFGGGIPQFYVQNLFQVSDSFSFVKGSHAFKVGIDYQRQQLNMTSASDYRGIMSFNGWDNSLAGVPLRFVAVDLTQSSRVRGWRRILFGWYAQDEYRVTPRLTINLGLRHEVFTNPSEVNGLSASLVNITDATSTLGPPFRTSKTNFAPRFGMAWDPTGSGKTSVRVGLGVYYDQVDGRTWQHHAQSDSRFWRSYQVDNPAFPYGTPAFIPARTQNTFTVEHEPATPTQIHYNVEVQRQLTSTLSARIGFVGSRGYNMGRFMSNQNIRAHETLADGAKFYPGVQTALVNPNFVSITRLVFDARDNYHGLQAQLQKNVTAGFRFQVSYAYSKAMSISDATTGSQILNTSAAAMDIEDPERDYSLSAYHQQQNLTVNARYQMPWDKLLTSRIAKGVLGGWSINGIFKAASGPPTNVTAGYTDYSGGTINGTPTPGRPDLAPGFSNDPTSGTTAGCTGVAAGQKLGTPELWFDPCAFTTPRTGTFGNLGRNTITGPPLHIVDFTLAKDTALGEGKNLEFRAEFFNLLNHPNFLVAEGARTLFTNDLRRRPTAGRLTSTATLGREIQFGLKLTF